MGGQGDEKKRVRSGIRQKEKKTKAGAAAVSYTTASRALVLAVVGLMARVWVVSELLNSQNQAHAQEFEKTLMYVGEANNPMNLKQILCRPIKKVGFRGPLITSICALILSSLTLIGLAILGIILYTTTDNPLITIFGVLYMALFVKHIEWSGIWNMGMVVSILEEHGTIGISWYRSKAVENVHFF
ncbi:hypothetical protein Dsin_002318 [Dipteronia sinensis]|uniref:Uncharacterized protein n=1 Tax=Dipteronia sinensis TaxID=43782 RepID=A0AAE0EJV3_9ROSI|nr:hypothetical protein Dsin_002318 [Dipteronia sinensis]